MATNPRAAGRGRGRGALLFAEKRPGGDNQGPQDEDTKLSTLISSLSLEPEEGEILPVTDAAKKYCSTKSKIIQVMDLLYNRCLKDWHFSRSAAYLCQKIIDIEAENESLRTVLLKTIQQDFKLKESLRQEDNERFLGCVSFLCQVLCTVRTESGTPFIPLIAPVFESLELLLDNKASNREIECAAYQLVDLCSVLYNHGSKEKIARLLNSIKDKIVEGSGSKESRYQLIHAVEKLAVLKAS